MDDNQIKILSEAPSRSTSNSKGTLGDLSNTSEDKTLVLAMSSFEEKSLLYGVLDLIFHFDWNSYSPIRLFYPPTKKMILLLSIAIMTYSYSTLLFATLFGSPLLLFGFVYLLTLILKVTFIRNKLQSFFNEWRGGKEQRSNFELIVGECATIRNGTVNDEIVSNSLNWAQEICDVMDLRAGRTILAIADGAFKMSNILMEGENATNAPETLLLDENDFNVPD